MKSHPDHARAIASALTLCAILLAFPALSSCASKPEIPYGPFVVHGMVYSASGLPVPDAAISLPGGASTLSDFNGRFSFRVSSTGPVKLTFSKEGYETLESASTISSPKDIIYASMLSARELLDMAEARAESRRWTEADSFVSRALALNPSDVQARYLAATLRASSFRADRDPAAARDILESIVSDGHSHASVYRLLWILYDSDLGDKEKAILNLER